jgi:ribosome-binding protein aMBF1 (putative translation factor)
MSKPRWQQIFDDLEASQTPAQRAEADAVTPDIEAFLATLTLMMDLRASRKAQGMTQQQLAAKTGMSQGEISRVERLAIVPQSTTLLLIAKALGYALKLEALPAAA